MIRTLRRKFIIVAMISVIAVLAVILGVINILNYRSVISDADETLQILADNNGIFPGIRGEEERDFPPLPTGEENSSTDTALHPLPAHMSPEAPYETRYFSILTDENDQVIHTDFDRIAAVDSSSAEEYAANVLSASGDRGFIGDYRYYVKSRNNSSLLLFLDCHRTLSTFRRFLIASILIAAAGSIAVFVLVVLLSGRAVRPFVEAYDKQKRFITDAGHEIKTPLTIIDADAAVLEMDTGENEWIADIKKQTVRLRDLTNDLIYLSRMEESGSSLAMSDFPVSETAQEMADSFRAAAIAQNKKFACSVEPMLTLHGDAKSIERLISIMLDNALKYSPEGGHIDFSLRRKGKSIHLTVSNSCETPDSASLPNLFERFYRTDASRNSETGGHGIGLSIAKAIVQAHKGTISAEIPEEGILTIKAVLNQ